MRYIFDYIDDEKISPPKESLATIAGKSSDYFGVERVEIKIDDSDYRLATGTNNWSIDWDISDHILGNHIITVKSIDLNGLISYDESMFVLNESDHSWGPNINSFYHKPENPTNITILKRKLLIP